MGGRVESQAEMSPHGLVSSPKGHTVSYLWWQERPYPGLWWSGFNFRM